MRRAASDMAAGTYAWCGAPFTASDASTAEGDPLPEKSARVRALALILATASIPVLAAEGRIPIPFTSPPTTPVNITAPGRYVLTRSLTATGSGAVVVISASGPVAGAHNQVEGNVLNGNGRGLVFEPSSTQNVYRGNTARGNTGAAACTGACSNDFCNAGVSGNSSQGDNFMPQAPCN